MSGHNKVFVIRLKSEKIILRSWIEGVSQDRLLYGPFIHTKPIIIQVCSSLERITWNLLDLSLRQQSRKVQISD